MDIQAMCLAVLAMLLVVLTEAENPQIVPNQGQNNQGIHMNQQRAHGSRFRDKQHIQDKEHLKEHYDGFVDFDHLNYEQMRDEEIAFHYFKIHDTDNNNRLDGLEIMQAMVHNKEFKKEIKDEEEEDAEVEEEEEEEDEHHIMDEATILTIVDQVLQDDDLNNDGHIMEHLEEVIDKPESEMTEAELQLHYFKMHDYDNNNKLDGLELIQALTHYHHDDEGGEPKKDMSEQELVDLIDPIFEEEDENKDGYIDYPEFAKTQS